MKEKKEEAKSEALLDKLWDVFSSMKTGLVLLGLVALASGIGTFFPQKNLEPDKAEAVSKFWQALGFTDVYGSVWFQLLVGLLCINLVVCSVQRFGGIYKKTFNPSVPESSKRVPHKLQAKISGTSEALYDTAKEVLSKKGFKVTTSEEGKLGFAAQKKRWGNWGSLITHIAFVVLIIGALVGSMYGVKGFMFVGTGSTTPIKAIDIEKGKVKENFSVRINSAEDRFLPSGERDNWYTDMSIIEGNKEVARQTISVNHPFTYKGFTFYQSSFGNGASFTVDAQGKKTPIVLRERGGNYYQVPGTDYFIVAAAMKADPKAPAVLYQVFQGNGTKPIKMAQMQVGQTENIEDKFTLKFEGLAGFTGLQVKSDPGVWLVWLGSGLLMFGLILSFYWRPVNISGYVEKGTNGDATLTIGTSAGKILGGLESEFNALVKEIDRQPAAAK